VVYALQIDQLQALEHAAISGGGEIAPGSMVDSFEEWLSSEPEPVDIERAQLMAALGVSP
jgi:hypothetical protein